MNKISDTHLLNELKERFEKNKHSLEELEKITEQLTGVNKKLEESQKLKSHFISNITNELVNPFTSIIGLSRNILSIKDDRREQVKKMIELIYVESYNLNFQLKNIFTASNLESGNLKPFYNHTNLHDLFESIIQNAKFDLVKKNITLEYNFELTNEAEKSYRFYTDEEKIQLILDNLLNNAIKYSKKDSTIKILWQIKNDFLIFSVIDQGVGINNEDQKLIFDRFKRVNYQINSVTPGHGLGLSIVKSLTDMLDGIITMESKQNTGSKFSVSIPDKPIADTRISMDDDFDDEIDFSNGEVF